MRHSNYLARQTEKQRQQGKQVRKGMMEQMKDLAQYAQPMRKVLSKAYPMADFSECWAVKVEPQKLTISVDNFTLCNMLQMQINTFLSQLKSESDLFSNIEQIKVIVVVTRQRAI